MNRGLKVFLLTCLFLGVFSLDSMYLSTYNAQVDESPLITELKKEIENIDKYFETYHNNPDFTQSIEKAMYRNLQSNEKLDFTNPSLNSCENRKQEGSVADFYYFIPSMKAIVGEEGTRNPRSKMFESPCFKDNILTLESIVDGKATFTLESHGAKSWTCSDSYLLVTSRIHHPLTVFLRGKHKIVIENLNENDLAEIKTNGFRLMGFCQNIIESLKSIYMTARLFLGGFSVKHAKIPEYMEKQNIKFIKEFVGFDYKPRSEAVKDKILDLKNEIKSGDFVAITRLDGLDEMIMMGTGSSIGHTCVAMWIDGELYVVESQDGWYWPNHGIQRNKWEDWVNYAHNADFNVVIIPLSEEARSKFNVEKALEWFRHVEGLNYGYHNFVYGWIDTVDKNLPTFMDFNSVTSLLGVVNSISPKTIDLIIGQGLNHRVGTKGLNFNEVIAEASKKGLSMEDLAAIREEQHWQYTDGENYVCSAFCTGMYKAGGLFDDLDIVPQEFGPKDVYQLSFFDPKPKRPQVCVDADPDLDFCQVMGKYGLVFKGVGSIKPYNKMNEKCPSQHPLYERPSDC